MIDMIRKGLQEAADAIREQTANLGEGAKEKTYEIIEDWLTIFPKLEVYGLEISSFALGLAISPSLEVELVAAHEKFSPAALQQMLADNKDSTSLTMVFTAIKTAYTFHRRTLATLREPLVVKIRVKLAPEVKVIIGQPLVA